MKNFIFILFTILLVSCGETFDSDPHSYTGKIKGTKHEPSHTTMRYSAQKGRMVMDHVPDKYYVYYEFLGENRTSSSHQFYDTCVNNNFQYVEIIYVERYSINKNSDTTFRRNVIVDINPK